MTETFTCPGFKAAGVAAAIKKAVTKDLGLVFSETPATVAAVFTKNRVISLILNINLARMNIHLTIKTHSSG